MPGRPQYARRKETHEKKKKNPSEISRRGRQIRCSKCKQYGHNKKTCKWAEIVTNVASNSRGRQSRRQSKTQTTPTRSTSRRQSQPTPPRTMSTRATQIKVTENVPVTQHRPKLLVSCVFVCVCVL